MKNLPIFNLPDSILEIEIFADFIYCIFYGNLNIMTDFKNILNKHMEINKINKKYIIAKLNFPIAKIDDLDEFNKINLDYDNSLELIQCIVYANCNNKDAKNMYALLCLENNENETSINLKYPNFELKNNSDPEELLYKEMKKLSQLYAKQIKKNIKLLDIVGDNNEILVYSCKLS